MGGGAEWLAAEWVLGVGVGGTQMAATPCGWCWRKRDGRGKLDKTEARTRVVSKLNFIIVATQNKTKAKVGSLGIFVKIA